MRTRLGMLLAAALAVWTPVWAQDGLERVELRVSSTWPGKVVVDRGTRDALAIGDVVTFHPRTGGTIQGTVASLKERSAVVEFQNTDRIPPAGTRGEVMIPTARLTAPPTKEEKKETPPSGDKTAEGTGEHPPWQNKDEDYKEGAPLLSGMKPIRPKDREKTLTGRAYLIAQVTESPSGNYDNSFLRIGTDLIYNNPFSKGGSLRINAEIDYLTEFQQDELTLDLLVRRLSYTRGGTRFSDTRWEVGRFLQHAMPEFGVLDGGEWSMRRSNGHRFGASVGFMPELLDDFDTGDDLQFSVWYEWVSDDREWLTVAAGYQKTWHNGAADRDLLVTRIRYLPLRGWKFNGTFWVDFYTGGDAIKGEGVELTQAVASLNRQWKNSGLDIIYTRFRFPEILRNGEFIPPIFADEIANNRYDRLAANYWRQISPKTKLHGHLSGWDDEDDSGGAGELGLDWQDLLGRNSRLDVTGFVGYAQFEEVYGLRAEYVKFTPRGRWEFTYEITEHRLLGFPPDVDDLIQHRARIGRVFYTVAGIDFNAWVEGVNYDEEFAWTVGLNLQKRF